MREAGGDFAGDLPLRLETNDEAGGDGLRMDVLVELSDAAAVAEVDDAPVEVGDEREVDADDAAVGEVTGDRGRRYLECCRRSLRGGIRRRA